MKKIALIFGGAGYIGTHLLRVLLDQRRFDIVYILDIKELKGFGKELEFKLVVFQNQDVREEIKVQLTQQIDIQNSWIFNFAAVHREPGHEFKEYFDTNIPGAENINQFARDTGIQNIFFTSSIAPYGRSLEQRTEISNLYPETGYGISKGYAERIHREWLKEDSSRRLVIVRPSVIFGPKDPGNVYRMIKALKKGTFVLPDGGKVVKAYGYVYGLVDSMLFTMDKQDTLITYNYAENPVVALNEMVQIAKDELSITKPTLKLSVKFLAFIAFWLQVVFKLIGKKSDIHPVRVKKAGFPTNIKPKYLIDNGFEFKYDFRNALQHWKSISPEDFK